MSSAITFADLNRMLSKLEPVDQRADETAYVMHPAAYLMVRLLKMAMEKRAMHKLRHRTLYGYRMACMHSEDVRPRRAALLVEMFKRGREHEAKQFQGWTADQAETIAELLLGTVSLPAALFKKRRARDRYMGRPDMFWCCDGTGLHHTKLGTMYCSCQAGQLRHRTDLDQAHRQAS